MIRQATGWKCFVCLTWGRGNIWWSTWQVIYLAHVSFASNVELQKSDLSRMVLFVYWVPFWQLAMAFLDTWPNQYSVEFRFFFFFLNGNPVFFFYWILLILTKASTRAHYTVEGAHCYNLEIVGSSQKLRVKERNFFFCCRCGFILCLVRSSFSSWMST